MLVWSETAPDVVEYPDIALCVWGELAAGVPTGYFYTYNGVAWTAMKLVPGSIDGDSFANGTIGIDKLEPGTPLYFLQTNAGGDGLQWGTIDTGIPNNSITPAKLQNAVGAGYIFRSGTGGVFTTVLLQTAVENLSLPIATTKDTLGTGLANQVAYLPAKDGSLTFGYVETLLRDATIPTTKLQFSPSLKGKWLKVNAGGTDFDAYDSPIEVATFVDTTTAGGAPQGLLAATLTTVRLAAESSMPSWASVASSEITLTAGTYVIEAVVPVFPVQPSISDTLVGYVAWVEGSTTKKTANLFWEQASPFTDDAGKTLILYYKTTLAATTVCKLRAYFGLATNLGRATSLAAEVYTQLKITRL